MKNDIEVFLRYAAAFEEAYATDQWDKVREFFAEDAVYEVEAPPPLGGKWTTRDGIVDHLIESVNTFDRTYDERVLGLTEGPEMKDGAVWVRWSGVYKKKGQPDLASK